MSCHIGKLGESICYTDLSVKYMRTAPRAALFQEASQRSCLINRMELDAVSAVA